MTEGNTVTTMSPSTARILIAETDTTTRHSLRDALVDCGYDVVAESSSGQQAIDLARRLKPDLAILSMDLLSSDSAESLPGLIDDEITTVILLSENTDGDVSVVRTETIFGYLGLPLRAQDLVPVIEVALARHAEILQLRERIAELEDALETRKLVERAKGILMDLHGLSEADAFRRMRKTSMDNRKTMREVAEAILLSHDLQLGSDLI